VWLGVICKGRTEKIGSDSTGSKVTKISVVIWGETGRTESHPLCGSVALLNSPEEGRKEKKE